MMRHALPIGLFALVATLAPRSSADDDAVPAPNALLLVDTSTSMEQMVGTTAEPGAKCTVDGFDHAANKTRWMTLVETLTGSVPESKAGCELIPRTSGVGAKFDRYRLPGGGYPGDLGEGTPHYNLLSNRCGVQPNPAARDAFDDSVAAAYGWSGPAGESWWRVVNANDASLCAAFEQNQDGLLHTFKNDIRFGLMTFDSAVGPQTGLKSLVVDHADGGVGQWSYFLNGTFAHGRPVGCYADQTIEVGARNAMAPPWEGRLVPLPVDDAELATDPTNGRIQDVLRASRPYGATPIDALMNDARDYFWYDQGKYPPDSDVDIGPYRDQFVSEGCRDNLIILLTDGEPTPSLSLRPSCEAKGTPDGSCPYEQPWDIAEKLAAGGGGAKVRTFVVGFALDKIQNVADPSIKTCEDVAPSAWGANGLCEQYPNEPTVQACCTLKRIAASGGTEAFFASDGDALRKALSDILSEGLPISTRTSAVGTTTSAGISARVLSGYKPQSFALWNGVLHRTRLECNANLVAKAQTLDASKGDLFEVNINTNPTARFIGAFKADKGGSDDTLRPQYTGAAQTMTNDGVNQVNTQRLEAPIWQKADGFAAQLKNVDLGINKAGDTTDATAKEVVRFLLGLSQGGAGTERCGALAPSGCSLLGEINRSTPAIVAGVPTGNVNDATYEKFVRDMAGLNNASGRPTTLYVSSNDGLLHAFDLDAKSNAQNELWAFIPPAALNGLKDQYPGARMRLLDGKPVVADVRATADWSRFERSASELGSGAGSGTWRTVLVQALGLDQSGYFALDVTDPKAATPARFLWQLTTRDLAGTRLFGTGGTPLITTLLLKSATGGPAKEVAVAVLPGGNASPTPLGSCEWPAAGTPLVKTDAEGGQTKLRCYDTAGLDTKLAPTVADAAKSLTIVRLDTGEVVRTFRPGLDKLAANLVFADKTLTPTPLGAPITGEPAAFPGRVGDVADRIFVGDGDGVLWQVDVSNSEPAKWTMEVAADAYYDSGDPSKRQPITRAPALSFDAKGQLVVIFATGSQEDLASMTSESHVYSMTEATLPGKSKGWKLSLNWRETLKDGEKFTGDLQIFNHAVYFSSVKPNLARVCTAGDSAIWGLDYKTPAVAGAGLTKGAGARMVDGSSLVKFVPASTLEDPQESGAENLPVFGVTVAAMPTCSGTEEDFTGDALTGLGGELRGTVRGSSTVKAQGVQLVTSVGTIKVLERSLRPTIADSWVHLTE